MATNNALAAAIIAEAGQIAEEEHARKDDIPTIKVQGDELADFLAVSEVAKELKGQKAVIDGLTADMLIEHTSVVLVDNAGNEVLVKRSGYTPLNDKPTAMDAFMGLSENVQEIAFAKGKPVVSFTGDYEKLSALCQIAGIDLTAFFTIKTPLRLASMKADKVDAMEIAKGLSDEERAAMNLIFKKTKKASTIKER